MSHPSENCPTWDEIRARINGPVYPKPYAPDFMYQMILAGNDNDAVGLWRAERCRWLRDAKAQHCRISINDEATLIMIEGWLSVPSPEPLPVFYPERGTFDAHYNGWTTLWKLMKLPEVSGDVSSAPLGLAVDPQSWTRAALTK